MQRLLTQVVPVDLSLSRAKLAKFSDFFDDHGQFPSAKKPNAAWSMEGLKVPLKTITIALPTHNKLVLLKATVAGMPEFPRVRYPRTANERGLEALW